MESSRGNRGGILVVGDSLPSNTETVKNIKAVLDPEHPVYNSLIVPINSTLTTISIPRAISYLQKKWMVIFSTTSTLLITQKQNLILI